MAEFTNEQQEEIKSIVMETLTEEGEAIEDLTEVNEMDDTDTFPIIRTSNGVKEFAKVSYSTVLGSQGARPRPDGGGSGDSITVDDTITENGTNPVTGGAIYAALAGKVSTSQQNLSSEQKAQARTNIGAGTGNGTVTQIKVGLEGSPISPDNGIVTIPTYETGAEKHKAPTASEVKQALGTGSGTTKFLREDGTWQTPPSGGGGGGGITEETDPTVPSWAKAESKPTYTASEVGAVPTTRKVNNKALSADITLSASDVGALPSNTPIPSIDIASKADVEAVVDELEDSIPQAGSNEVLVVGVDGQITQGGTNPVAGNAIYSALSSKADKSDTYTKSQVDSMLSNTAETDAVIVDVPSGSDTATYLSANIPSGSRANRVFRVPDEGGTTYSEWAWDGTVWVKLRQSGIEQEKFDNIVGDGLKTDVGLVEYERNSNHEIYGASDCVFVPKGSTVCYSICQRGNGAIIFQISQTYVANWYDVGDSNYPYTLFVVKTNEAGVKKIYKGVYTATQDCYVKYRGFMPEETYHPTDISSLTIYTSFTQRLKTDAVSRGRVSEFELGQPVTLFSNRDSNNNFDSIDYFINWGSVVTVRPGLYYMYYEAKKTSIVNAEGNDNLGISLAWSTNGTTWNRSIPSGATPAVSGMNVLFPLSGGKQRAFGGAQVVKVSDSEYPYRMIGNKEWPKTGGHYYKMYMFKSSDGIDWGDFDDDGIEISGLPYDSQYSVIPYGGILKVYVRMWDYTYDIDRQRTIGVMFIDLDGNVVTPATELFGNGYYNSAAFKIDERRELLLPTLFKPSEDTNRFGSYIVDGDTITGSSDIDAVLRGSGDRWGAVNPGFLLKGGDVYITYNQWSAWHNEIESAPSNWKTEMRMAKLTWKKNGSTNNNLLEG